jgi:hypothetical protein
MSDSGPNDGRAKPHDDASSFPVGRTRQSIYYSNLIIRIGNKVLPFGRTAVNKFRVENKLVFAETVLGVFVARCNIGVGKKPCHE